MAKCSSCGKMKCACGGGMTRMKKAMGGVANRGMSASTRATGSAMGAGGRTPGSAIGSGGARGAGGSFSKPSSRLSRAKGGVAKKMKKGK